LKEFQISAQAVVQLYVSLLEHSGACEVGD